MSLCVAQRKTSAVEQGPELLAQSPGGSQKKEKVVSVERWFGAGSQLHWSKACASENQKVSYLAPLDLQQLSGELRTGALAWWPQT